MDQGDLDAESQAGRLQPGVELLAGEDHPAEVDLHDHREVLVEDGLADGQNVDPRLAQLVGDPGDDAHLVLPDHRDDTVHYLRTFLSSLSTSEAIFGLLFILSDLIFPSRNTMCRLANCATSGS